MCMYNFNEISEYKNTMRKFDKAEHSPVHQNNEKSCFYLLMLFKCRIARTKKMLSNNLRECSVFILCFQLL